MTTLLRKLFSVGKRIGVVGLVGLAPLGYAEPDAVWNGEVFGDWQYECAERAKGIRQCALVQSIIDTGTLEPMLRLSFAQSTVDETVTASVLLPLGVELEEGVRLHFGTRNILLPFRVCVFEGCLARREISAELLRDLARAEGLNLAFFALGRIAVAEAPASSRGLREAFYRLGFVLAD